MGRKLHVADPWLYYIIQGKKLIEGRRGSEKQYSKWINKDVTFYNENSSIKVKVIQIRWYPNLYDYLSSEGISNVVSGIDTFENAVKIYHQYYSDDDIIKSGGMCAIIFTLYI